MGKPKITLYDFNKENMAQIDPYTKQDLEKLCNQVAEYIWGRKQTAEDIWGENSEDKTYWMLLCRERNDYTVFCIKDSMVELADAIKDCLVNRGQVLDITKQEDGNYEIWIRDYLTRENVVYYLFDYNSAIIEV